MAPATREQAIKAMPRPTDYPNNKQGYLNAFNLWAARNPNTARSLTKADMQEVPAQNSTQPYNANDPKPQAIDAEQQARAGGPQATTTPTVAQTPAADDTYTDSTAERRFTPLPQDAWFSPKADATADGGVNWKGTGNLEADHPDWYGEVKNFATPIRDRMLNDYAQGNEADFQDARDVGRANHMMVNGWANPDGTTPTKSRNPKGYNPQGQDPNTVDPVDMWMKDNPVTTTKDTTTPPAPPTNDTTRNQPVTPPDTTDTQTVSVSDGALTPPTRKQPDQPQDLSGIFPTSITDGAASKTNPLNSAVADMWMGNQDQSPPSATPDMPQPSVDLNPADDTTTSDNGTPDQPYDPNADDVVNAFKAFRTPRF